MFWNIPSFFLFPGISIYLSGWNATFFFFLKLYCTAWLGSSFSCQFTVGSPPITFYSLSYQLKSLWQWLQLCLLHHYFFFLLPSNMAIYISLVQVLVSLFILLPRCNSPILPLSIYKDLQNCLAWRNCSLSILKVSGKMIVIKQRNWLKTAIIYPIWMTRRMVISLIDMQKWWRKGRTWLILARKF